MVAEIKECSSRISSQLHERRNRRSGIQRESGPGDLSGFATYGAQRQRVALETYLLRRATLIPCVNGLECCHGSSGRGSSEQPLALTLGPAVRAQDTAGFLRPSRTVDRTPSRQVSLLPAQEILGVALLPCNQRPKRRKQVAAPLASSP